MPPKGEKSSSKSRKKGEDSKEIGPDPLALGSFIWVKLDGSTWWPGQVVDENTISKHSKPGNKSNGQVLVRVYGSSRYLYVDPVKCSSEFEKILKQNNGSCRDIFEKSLKQDLLALHSGTSGSQPSKSKGNGSASASKKKSNQTPVTKNKEHNREACAVEDLEPTARRKRVMRSLGLMPPSGSPFKS